jgi:hypothetical protein
MVIIYENYKFSKLKYELYSDETKWRCSIKTSRAFLKTMGQNNYITKKNVNHNHLTDS